MKKKNTDNMNKQKDPLGKNFNQAPMLRMEIKGRIFRPIW